MSRKNKQRILFRSTAILEPLMVFPQMHGSLAAFLISLGRHPDLLDEPPPRGGTLRLTQLMLLREALGQASTAQDVSALRRVVRYLTNLHVNDAQRDEVEAELERLRSQFPDPDLWPADECRA